MDINIGCNKHGCSDLVTLKSGRVECRICQREYQNKHYKTNNYYYKNKASLRNNFLSNFLIRVKRLRGCENCGEKRWWVLDFHHINSDTKLFNVATCISFGYSMNKIKNEIRKCVVLCSNCHRDLHYKQGPQFDSEPTQQIKHYGKGNFRI